jgi:hypothetical protein
MGDPSAEVRRFPRLKQACQIRYRKLEPEGMPEVGTDGVTVNISGGGIAFEVSEAVEPGALLAIEMTLPEYESAVVSLGRAVWCREGGGGKYELGMEFWWIGWGDDGAQMAISGYIKKALEG